MLMDAHCVYEAKYYMFMSTSTVFTDDGGVQLRV